MQHTAMKVLSHVKNKPEKKKTSKHEIIANYIARHDYASRWRMKIFCSLVETFSYYSIEIKKLVVIRALNKYRNWSNI